MTTIKKIALVSSAPISYTRVPAGLAFMAGVCEHHNVDYEIFDLNIGILKDYGKKLYEEIYEIVATSRLNYNDQLPTKYQKILKNFSTKVCKKIMQEQCDAVAVTVLSYQQSFWTAYFLTSLKEMMPHVKVIVGGPGIGTDNTIDPSAGKMTFGKYLVEKNLADYYVLGEGDVLFGDFLLGQADGKPGFNTKNKEESWQPQLDDLDATPMPSYKKIKFSDYAFFEGQPEVTLTASRGCVRDCTFCDIGFFWKKYRFRSGDRVAQEMYKSYVEMGVKKFWFNDSLMNGSFKAFFDLMENLKKLQDQDRGFADIQYGGQLILRPKNTHTEQMYQMLSETGGKFFQVGIESGSEAVREHMRKKFSNEDIFYHYEMSSKFKIQNWIFMTLSYPTETEKDFQDTLDLYTALQKYLIDDTIVGTGYAGALDILPNTPLYSMMEEIGVHYLDDYKVPGQWKSISPDGLNSEEKKFLRFIKLTKHVLDLGYRVPHEFPARVNQHLTYFLSRTKQIQTQETKKQRKIIPIIQSDQSILS